MLDLAPDPLQIFMRPNTMTASQLDVINSFGANVLRLDFTFEIDTGGDNIFVGDPCTTPAAFCGNDITIAPTYSYPVTIICPPLPANTSITRMLEVKATIDSGGMGSNEAFRSVSVTCEALSSNDVYAANLVFPTTQIGTSSDKMLAVTSGFTATMLPLTVDPPTNGSFEITSCGSGCNIGNGQTAMVGIRCTPQANGSNAGFITLHGSNRTTTSSLECNGTSSATMPDAGIGGGGDGGNTNPDGGGPGGPGNPARDPESFYACSATALAGALPVIGAIVLAMIRRRR